MIEYISLGDTHRIGASSHYLRLGDWGIILDAGIDPDWNTQNHLPDYDSIADQPVNAIIVSHAHLDHLGSLPVALRYFPQARVYMTPATAALSEVMLFHYLRVKERKSLLDRKEYKSSYTNEDIENILYLFQSFEYNFPFRIHSFQESKISITFWDAGHILGSAGVEIQWRGRRIFYTGNTKKSSQFILKGASYPHRTDFLITEATYGNNEDAPRVKRRQEITRFVNFLNEKINFGGAVLIPVFALGRTQEMMMLLHRLTKNDKLSPVPIYLFGLGIKINKIYDKLLHKIYPQYDARLLHTISSDTLSSGKLRKPCIVLATSGMMLLNTLSYDIARDFVSDPKNGIAIVGWADPETPGGFLREKKIEKIKSIFSAEKVNCSIEIFLFSAHSHREELIHMIKSLHPRKMILCHGEYAALEWMQNRILDGNICEQVFIPQKFQKIQLW